MNFGEYTDYKKAIKDRLKELQPSRPGLTLKRIAEKIPIQYTYLSKVLNDRGTHLNEDHLYQVGELLELYPHETDFLILLRSYQTTENPARKQKLFKRIEKISRDLGLSANQKSGDELKLQHEMDYLMDPLCALVLVALHIPQYRHDPKQLCAPLGISLDRLKGVLGLLSRTEHIETGTSPFQILKLHQSRTHFDKNHPLTRMHQHLVSIRCQDQVLKLDEEDKESIQITFTADEQARKRIQASLRTFLKQVESEVRSAQDAHVYQMNLQLFRWV